MSRKLPDTVSIEVVEREAAALVSIGGDLYLVTRDGDLFKKPEPGDPFDLPVDHRHPGRRGRRGPARRRRSWSSARSTSLAEHEHTGLAQALPSRRCTSRTTAGWFSSVGKDAIALHLGKGPTGRASSRPRACCHELASRNAPNRRWSSSTTTRTPSGWW